MPKPQKGIRRVVRKYANKYTDHEIIRYKRNQNEYIPQYVGGVAQPRESDRETIKLHHQPIGSGKLISSLPEGQRLEDVRKCWTEEDIKAKDKIVIEGFYFTVNGVYKWTDYAGVFIEADLLRTGEADNID